MTPSMPFGKFRGWPLAELPDDYLAWLSTAVTLREPLRTNVRRELSVRHAEVVRPGAVTLAIPHENANLALAVVEAGYRTVAKRLHPDAGGSNAGMVELNALIGDMRKQLTGRQS